MQNKPGSFTLDSKAQISYYGEREAASVSEQLAHLLRSATGFELETNEGNQGDLRLLIDTTGTWHHEEYRLNISRRFVELRSETPEGLFRGIQTLRQLFPPMVESDTLVDDFDWSLPCLSISD